MKNMRVLHVNTEKGWRGGERQTLLTLQGLTSRGIWAGLVSQPESPLARAARESEIPTFEIKMKGAADVIAASRIRKVVRRNEVDLLHLQTSHAASIGLMARGFGKKPPLIASRRVDFPIKTAWKYNCFNAILPISKVIRDILINSGVDENKLTVIPSGVTIKESDGKDAAELRSGLVGEAGPVIGVIGHLADHKGHRFLIEAMPRVIEKKPGARLVIIGDGELRRDLEDRVRFFDLEKEVIFTGFREDVRNLISALDIYVHPSLLEGLCTTLFDVMLCGVPILASDTGGIPEALGGGKHGMLVPPGDPQALADGIIALVDDDKAKSELTSGSAAWVRENFSSDLMIDRTAVLYEKLLNGEI